jgi:hypothetical protein
MKSLLLAFGLALQAGHSAAPDISQECQVETVTLCDQAGCRGVKPTLKLYLGEYTAKNGTRTGYYYRCRRAAFCDIIDNPWIGGSGGYRAFVARDRGLISKIGPQNRITDVATMDDRVLVSRGRCWPAPRPEVQRSSEPTGR